MFAGTVLYGSLIVASRKNAFCNVHRAVRRIPGRPVFNFLIFIRESGRAVEGLFYGSSFRLFSYGFKNSIKRISCAGWIFMGIRDDVRFLVTCQFLDCLFNFCEGIHYGS